MTRFSFMSKRLISLAVAGIVLCLAPAIPSLAEYEPPQCRGFFSGNQTKDEFNAAILKLDKCQRDVMGVVPIEERAAAGQSVVRAFIWRGERALPLFIEYVRAGNDRAWLNVRTIDEAIPHYSWPISDGEFQAVRSRWLDQDRMIAINKRELEAEAAETAKHPNSAVESICINIMTGAKVETAAEGRSTRRDLDACNQPEYDFVDFLYAQALRDAGDCSERIHNGEDDERLLACLSQEAKHPGSRSN
jgi:hypothetical protein